MKKTLGFILLIISIFMFSSCSVKINTPEVPKAFTQNAVVTSGDFSYECEICKKEGSVSITVKNTNALGLVMTYDGKNVSFKYSTYSYDISGENFEKENINYHLNYEKEQTFKNITTTITNNKYVIISKIANPAIHFVIKHPKLVEAIDNFNPLVKE